MPKLNTSVDVENLASFLKKSLGRYAFDPYNTSVICFFDMCVYFPISDPPVASLARLKSAILALKCSSRRMFALNKDTNFFWKASLR